MSAWHRIIKLAESGRVFWLSIIIVIAAGVANNVLDLQSSSEVTQSIAKSRAPLYTLIQVVYYLIGLRLLTNFTPHLLGHIRPSVNIDDAAFAHFARRITGTQTRWLFALMPPAGALIWVASLVGRLITSQPALSFALDSLTYTPLPWVAVLISAVSLWRMWSLMRLSQQSLNIGLFDAHRVFPIGQLATLYSAFIIGGEMMRLFMFGSPNTNALLITGLTTVSAFITLLLPMWGVHMQMRDRKYRALSAIDNEIKMHFQPMLGSAAEKWKESIDPLLKLNTVRAMVKAAPEWPLPDTVSGVRAIFIALLPVAYTFAQRILTPLLTTILTALGLSSS